MEVVSVSSKGQVVIPEKVRKKLGIGAGSRLVLLEKEGSILLKREDAITKRLEETETKETIGWLILGEKSLEKVWDNAKDEKTWKRYL
ncbi:AbrB/MazE/SpoVT family DNA-binding domain-containing protein [Candidatus Woesearchaeota archaeon]|nr:AbrB/MazE/SpoVT family DNA-binding domain-containing protein [Candidatus Woesearchaeota archaeon]